jgi:hypothetical protein
MRTLESIYNANHLHPLRTSVYVRSSFNGSVNPVQQAIVNQLDGTADSLLPRLADRILAVHYGLTPLPSYANYGGQIPAYADTFTTGGTDYHPYFSTETYSMSGYIDYMGVWLRNKYQNNIFLAEKDFYDRWRFDIGANFGSASDNTIEPGGAEYFQSYFIVDSLKNPRTFRTNSPICTNGAAGDTLRFTYQGPLERDITYRLNIYNNSQVLLLSDTGRTGNYPSTQSNLQLPGHYLLRSSSPYRAELILNYGGCSYTFSDSIFINNSPTIYATSTTTFCQGGNLILQASAGSSFSWFRNDTAITGGVGPIINVNQSGNYYCRITSNGTCNGNSNHVIVNVLSNPDIVFSTNCFNTDSAEIRIISPGNQFSWVTGDTTSFIITKTHGGYRYYATVTQSNQCKRTNYKNFSIPISGFSANPHISTPDGLRAACNQDSLRLIPTQYCVGCLYNWTYDQNTITSIADYIIHPAPDSSFEVTLHMISSSGCDGYDTATIQIYHCCSAQDTTIFGSDSTSHYSNWTNRTFNIAGDLIVNSNFTISGSNLLMDSSSKIVILPGQTLTIQNSRISSCNNMWKGISFGSSTSNLVMYGDTIEDAYQAISDSAGARFTVSNTVFNKNRRGIVIVGSANALTSSVTNCTFTYQENNGIVSQTKDGGSAYSGIEMSDMNGWNLNSNHFKHLYYGVKSENSSLVLTNSTFNDMRRYSYTYSNLRAASWTWMNDGYGIYSNNSSTGPISLTVQGNTFTNCGYGVATKNAVITDVSGSTFDSLRYTAVSIVNPTGVDVNIYNNAISRFLNGVSITEPRLANSSSINDNTFTTTANLNSSPLHNAAINWSVKLQNHLLGVTNAVVKNNQMNNQLKGVYLNGCEQVEVSANKIQLIGSSNPAKQYGIWLVNSPNCRISNDSIIAPSGISDPTHARGIRFESSTGCSINSNYFLNLGSGINGMNFCDLTTLCGNDMWNCARGIDVFNITLPVQGTFGSPQDNMWRNIPLVNRIVGSTANSSRLEFYHRYTQNNIFNKFSPGTNFIIQGTPNVTGFSPCSVPDTLPLMFSEITDLVIKDSIVFSLNNQENKWVAEKYAFHLLSEDSMLMYLGQPTDIQRQQFFNDLKQRNVGELENIQMALKEKDFLQAVNKLLSLQPENVIEQKLKDVYGLLEKTLSGNSLSEIDSMELDNISVQLAFEGGPAVFIARAILDVEFDDELTGALLRQAYHPDRKADSGLFLYPNPTNGKIVFSKELSQYSGCLVEVKDVHGVSYMISILNQNQNENIFEKDLSFLNSGIYIFQIYCDDLQIETLKIVIQK